MTRRPNGNIHVPPEAIYAAVTPRPPGRLTGRVAAYAVEGQLPRPLEDLALAWQVIDQHLVVLAVDRERAELWLTEGAISARPQALPTQLPEAARSTGLKRRFEFLQGSFLPGRIRTHRRLRRFAGLAAIMALAGAAAFGLHRRTESLHRSAGAIDAATHRLAREALPNQHQGIAPQLALTGELRRLRTLAEADQDNLPTDSRYTLAALLSHWPASMEARVESIEAAGDRLTLRTMLPDRDAAMVLSEAFAEDPRFEPELPRVTTESPRSGGEVTRLEVTLQHNAGGQ